MKGKICTVDRAELRRWIPEGYRPGLHLAGMYGVGLGVIGWLAGTYGGQLSRHHLLGLPVFLAVATLIEYLAHRWIMHSRQIWLPQAWEAHMGRHHHYYREEASTWEEARDVWLILFSPLDVVLLGLILAGPFVLLWWLVAPATWALILAECIAYFLLYEALHLSFHLPASHPLFRLGPLAALRARHLRHHRLADTHANFGVVCPLWDHLFGTARP